MIKILNIIFLLFFLLVTCNGNTGILCIDTHDEQIESSHTTIIDENTVKENRFSTYKLVLDKYNCDICYDIPLFDKIINLTINFPKNKIKYNNIESDIIFIENIYGYDLNRYCNTFLKTSSLNNQLQKLSTIILIV